ncbi:MAG: transposase domain-containing protein [Treponema sp.]|nr:transposase domain-containing protein [Treponema sp.]
METAKANGWNPLKYLTKVFQRAAVMKPSDDWGQILPWNLAPNSEHTTHPFRAGTS